MEEKEKQVEQITVYSNEPDSFLVFLKKIVRFRSLIWVFAIRDLKVKYAQTIIGVGWTIIQPLTALTIFTFFFGYVLNLKSGNLPFVLYILSGLLGWNFFSYIVSAGSNSVQESSHIIKKIYFPKSVLPFSKVLVALVELLLTLTLLIPLMFYFGQGISWRIIFLPLVLIFNALCGLTLVFWVASFAYKKRDLFHLLPFIVYFGIWFTPVFFTGTFLPPKIQFLMDFNPMANVVNLWRWMLFGVGSFQLIWLLNFGIVLILCLFGMYYYNRKESAFSDFA
jgi:lipopolysaccharide transport system permease protein